MKKILPSIFFLLFGIHAFAQDGKYETLLNIPYYSESVNQSDKYISERCVLDIYYPKNKTDFPMVVWFHGGGLSGGNKYMPENLREEGICIVAVNYRLHPEVSSPVYIEDAAAAVAWVFKNIDKYGGDPKQIFVAGHSAGGFLTSMVGLDKSWLARHNIDADNIAGLIPFSGHAITHFTIREERGIPGEQSIVDEYAPLFHVRPDAPLLVLITGDRNMELLGRYEEYAFFMRMMKVAGHKKTFLYELQGYNHGEMARPAFAILLKHLMKKVTDNSNRL